MTGKVADPSSDVPPSTGTAERRHHRRKERSSKGSKASSSAESGNSTKQRESTKTATTTPQPDGGDKEIFHIVATDTARERMRKISSVTDPCEPQYGVIVATETAHDRMRKMSKLGFEDPVDSIERDNNSNNNNNNITPNKKPPSRTRALRQSEEERAAAPRPRTSGRSSRQRVRPDESPRPDGKQVVGKATAVSSSSAADHDKPLSRSTPSRDRTRRSKSDGIKLSNAPLTPAVDGKNTTRPVVVTRRKSRTRSLDDMDEMFEQYLKKEVMAPPSGPMHQEGGGPAIGEVIAPSGEQKQLMRKISALGLEDPIFGNVHADMAVNHASMIFEDMNLEDIPDDMRDMLSVVSDHTDAVEMDDQMIESPVKTPRVVRPSRNSKPVSSRSLMNHMNSSLDALAFEPDYEPPAGSFIRRESKRNLMKESSNRNLQSSMMNPVVSGAQPQKATVTPTTTTKQRPTMTRSTPLANSSNSKTSSSEDTDPNLNANAFIPPSGSFRARRPRKMGQPSAHTSTGTGNGSSRRNKETLMQSIQRARKEEEQDAVKAAFGQSMPDLCFSSFDDHSFNNDSVKQRSSRSTQLAKVKKTSLRHVPHEEYIPPPAPTDMTSPGGGTHRTLPSLEFCFTPRRGVHRKTPAGQKHLDRTNMLQKGYSSRSCDDDFGLQQSPPGRPPALKASPDSVVLTEPSSPAESAKSKGSGRKNTPAIPRASRRSSAH
jgi:hypothetical protein